MPKGEIIYTNFQINFCGGCNNTVELKKFVMVDESETQEEALEKQENNIDDVLHKRRRFMAFCLCGNVYLLNS